jgi:hypothetical protein
MAVNYSKTFIDRAFESRDVFTLYDIVRTLDAERDLAEPFKLLVRMWEWCCSTRSGVWQYYENIPPAEFQETADLLDRFNLGEIAIRYRAGMENWEEPEYCGDLDDWIDDNWDRIETAAIGLIELDRESIYPSAKQG